MVHPQTAITRTYCILWSYEYHQRCTTVVFSCGARARYRRGLSPLPQIKPHMPRVVFGMIWLWYLHVLFFSIFDVSMFAGRVFFYILVVAV